MPVSLAPAAQNIYSHGITKLEAPAERHRNEYAAPLGLFLVWGRWLYPYRSSGAKKRQFGCRSDSRVNSRAVLPSPFLLFRGEGHACIHCQFLRKRSPQLEIELEVIGVLSIGL